MIKFEQIVLPKTPKYLTTYSTDLPNWPKYFGCLKKNIGYPLSVIFDMENWFWKSKLGSFWRPMWKSVKVGESQIKKMFLFYWFFNNNLFPVYPRPKNSTTEVTLTWDDDKQSFFRLTPSFGITLDTLLRSSSKNNRFLFSGGGAAVVDITVISVSGPAECTGCAYEAHDDFTNFSELVMFSIWF